MSINPVRDGSYSARNAVSLELIEYQLIPNNNEDEYDEQIVWLHLCIGKVMTYRIGFVFSDRNVIYDDIDAIFDYYLVEKKPYFPRVDTYLNMARSECFGIPLDVFRQFADAIRNNRGRSLISDCVRVGKNVKVNGDKLLRVDLTYDSNILSVVSKTDPDECASSMSYSIVVDPGTTADVFDSIHSDLVTLAEQWTETHRKPAEG
jgi:hypothetical protein